MGLEQKSKKQTNATDQHNNYHVLVDRAYQHPQPSLYFFWLEVFINSRLFYLSYFLLFLLLSILTKNLICSRAKKEEARLWMYVFYVVVFLKDKAALILEFWTMNCWISFECTFHFHMTSNHCTKIDSKWQLFRYFTLICLFIFSSHSISFELKLAQKTRKPTFWDF